MSDRDVDLRDVLGGFKDLGRVLDRYGREVFDELKKDIKEDMRDQKRDRRGVKGGAWAPRAQATRERAQRESKQKRRKSSSTGLLGKIATAWSGRADSHGLHMENKVKYAVAHHEGATVGHGAKLPARPHTDVDQRHVEDVIDVIEELGVELWEKRKR